MKPYVYLPLSLFFLLLFLFVVLYIFGSYMSYQRSAPTSPRFAIEAAPNESSGSKFDEFDQHFNGGHTNQPYSQIDVDTKSTTATNALRKKEINRFRDGILAGALVGDDESNSSDDMPQDTDATPTPKPIGRVEQQRRDVDKFRGYANQTQIDLANRLAEEYSQRALTPDISAEAEKSLNGAERKQSELGASMLSNLLAPVPPPVDKNIASQEVLARQNFANKPRGTQLTDRERQRITSDQTQALRQRLLPSTGWAGGAGVRFNGHQQTVVSTNTAVKSSTWLQHFWQQREQIDHLAFLPSVGYWENTYVPGDPLLRYLHAKLQQSTLQQRYPHWLQHANWQPFDAPHNAALAVYLSADHTAIPKPTRLLLQVGLQSTKRHSGRRPAMNVGLVLDLRTSPNANVNALIRALLYAWAEARRHNDRFSLTIAGQRGGTLIPSGEFRHGRLAVALQQLFGNATLPDKAPHYDIHQAVQQAMRVVKRHDNPRAPLGSSAVVLISAQSLQADIAQLEPLAHQSAVDGMPLSVIAVGKQVDLTAVDQLTLIGQGNRRWLQRASEAEALVDRELHAVSRAVARAIRLNIRLAPSVKLVEVIGAQRLATPKVHNIRQVEQSLDRRLSRNLGIQADRGQDDDGVQILIPSFYAGDNHVILLDVVAQQAGNLVDVSVRYKDLVFLRNGVTRANLNLDARPRPLGPLQRNVLKNLLALKLAQVSKQAGEHLAQGQRTAAIALLNGYQALLQQVQQEVLAWRNDSELQHDAQWLATTLDLVHNTPVHQQTVLADALQYAGFAKVLSSVSKF